MKSRKSRYFPRVAIGVIVFGLVFPFSLIARAASHPSDSEAIESYNLAFSTYLGGSGYDHARDIFVDAQGNIYVAGGTASSDFPRTLGPGFNNNNCAVVGSAGVMDVFVAKFDPNGGLLWSRLLGGPCYDRAYAIEVDSQGYIYISGRAGPGFPTTAGVVQPNFQGQDEGIYGQENAFVAKLAPDGTLIWASYIGVGRLARDLALDNNGDIYVPLAYSGTGGIPPAAWFASAYQRNLQGGTDCGAVKIKSDGTQVLWATWLGGSGDDSEAASIRVDANQNVYLGFSTTSNDIPTTAGAFDRSYNGGQDFYIAKLAAGGASLVFGTYFGGSGNEWISTHNLALDGQGNVYATTWTNSTDLPTSSGALQSKYGGGSSDMGIIKLSPTGARLASTYLGGSGSENPDGLYVDSSGIVYLTGNTSSLNFLTTSGAYHEREGGGLDAVVIRLAANFSSLLYSTYIGGPSDDDGRSGYWGQDGSLYITGQSSGSGWPTLHAFQNNFAGGALDAVVAKFTVAQVPTPTPPPSWTSWIYLPVVR